LSRFFAREVLLKTMFQLSFRDSEAEAVEEIVEKESLALLNKEEENVDPLKFTTEDEAYVNSIVKGVKLHEEEIRQAVQNKLHNWKLERLSVMDQALLKTAAYEILYRKDSPKSVVINETLNLIEKYGDPDSRKYINAVLDHLEASAADE